MGLPNSYCVSFPSFFFVCLGSKSICTLLLSVNWAYYLLIWHSGYLNSTKVSISCICCKSPYDIRWNEFVGGVFPPTPQPKILPLKFYLHLWRMKILLSEVHFRADEWNVNKWAWEGTLKVVSKGEECIIKLEDKKTGKNILGFLWKGKYILKLQLEENGMTSSMLFVFCLLMIW